MASATRKESLQDLPLSALKERREELDTIIAQKRDEHLTGLKTAMIQKLEENDTSVVELFSEYFGKQRARGTPRQHRTVRAKYRDPVGGTTWSGMGTKPRWLRDALAAGKSKDDFLIKEEPDQKTA